jgi:hypothetical protein
MRQYRSDKDDGTVDAPSSTAVAPPPQFLQHMIDYDDEHAEDTSFTEETIDDEYNSYINSVPKRAAAAAALDPLKFWEVSTYNYHSNYTADIKIK